MRSGYAIRPARVLDAAALGDVERAAAEMFAPYGLAELFSETSPVEKLAAAARTAASGSRSTPATPSSASRSPPSSAATRTSTRSTSTPRTDGAASAVR